MLHDSRVRYLPYEPSRPRKTARKYADPLSLRTAIAYAAVILGSTTVGWGLAHLPHPW